MVSISPRNGRGSSETSNSTTLSDPVELLKRTLSVKPVMSTTSSKASRMQRASVAPDRENFRTIGLGSCGSVFEVPGTELAYKKGSIESEIWKDFCLTNKVHIAGTTARHMLQNIFPELMIPRTPRCHNYHPADDEAFWSAKTVQRFPPGHRTRKPLFAVDRILPLPQKSREALIDLFFDQSPATQQEARDDVENKDCLVRTYLGERESEEQVEMVYNSLRNFPLRLNMMEDLGLEIMAIANEIAVGLAIMHWQAKVDAMDVEFVLGSAVTWDDDQPVLFHDLSAAPHTVRAISFKRRTVHLWMFDFDKASEVNFTIDDVNGKLVPAFLGNDPYYPMPHIDRDLWDSFSGTYIKASEAILRNNKADESVMGLPKRFLDEVVRRAEENKAWDEEDNVVFAV
ncbi:MAG: hypothetical protein HETSPECPRED_009020 [Heterodermia speciosa]|uniref:DUF3669 domain-containing protein n=1 Tax=Heterodermia speciosa TaxID=116794 RepID=A0A8H3FZG1_9LECA|nr:MAG: hypothetical protein HETSPECPRED_009020 [Heterodermia speciosa]